VDAISGLKAKTNFGRPHWESIFHTVGRSHPGKDVGVFFCGPKQLSTQLHKLSNKYSSNEPQGVRFFYNKENF
jgi:NADPH oxidase 2